MVEEASALKKNDSTLGVSVVGGGGGGTTTEHREEEEGHRSSTLSALLAPSAVEWSTLHERYGGLLELVRKLIGVIPNCDPMLEIWPIAFRSYNVMVPNLLNLPFFLWGLGAPKSPVALAMYASSRAAECMYCSAHTCSFALRRGASPKTITAQSTTDHDARERAAIDVAEALSVVPARITSTQRDELRHHLSSPAHAESVVLSIAMMGFLNKFMDAMGIDLEESTVSEVKPHIASEGWSTGQHRVVPTSSAHAGPPSSGDTLALKLGLVRFLPAAIALDRRWTSGVPSRSPAVGEFLQAQTGHDFPVLRRLTQSRAVRAIATMVRDNCAAEHSKLGLDVKYRAGIVFATVMQNDTLSKEMRKLAMHVIESGDGKAPASAPAAAVAADLDTAHALGVEEQIDFEDEAVVRQIAAEHGRALCLAKAASYSPARVTPAVIKVISSPSTGSGGDDAVMSPEAIVELMTWLSVLQLLHRLECFYNA